MFSLLRRGSFFFGVLLILGGVSGCSGGRSAFQVESEDRYSVVLIKSIKQPDSSTSIEEEHLSLIKVSNIPNICRDSLCFVTRRIRAKEYFPDSQNGVSGEIVWNKELRELGYIPHNIPSLSSGQAYVLMPIPKPKQ